MMDITGIERGCWRGGYGEAGSLAGSNFFIVMRQEAHVLQLLRAGMEFLE